ncbi:centrosomal protein CCDC61-like isoform X3 [Phalacrocorax aristotelis]|uniref:centrosomal protein CCDC61-like isoform X3 n=1 Tax=Phalacrocorax aristotelis TaxID=126867 RepID=UPI003F4C34C8
MGLREGGAAAEVAPERGGRAMVEPRYLQVGVTFRHGVHTIRLMRAPSKLEVEVEAHLTADTWRGEFDADFIEDLTRKTGNFKQFGIFCDMLESALMQSSRSVTLELLTYADLETLRSQKMGAISRPPLSSASHLNAKRYLILVYSVEFDRIHYPLPLPYAGKLDPAALHRLVCDLREELAQLRAQRKDSHRDTEIRRLQDELQRALEEKQAQAAALRHTEEKLTREKARHWREHRKLTAELAEATASEQRLQLQVKSLTAELASYKRGRRTPAGAGPHPQERRSLSDTRLPPSRSASRESRNCSQGRPQPRSPSPAGPRPPRFDPTAFVRARQRRQKEAERKNQRSRAAFGSTSLARSSSAESFRSWRSAVSSGSEADERSELLPPRGRSVTRTRRLLSTSSCNSPDKARRPAAGRKLSAGSAAAKRAGKENHHEEPAAKLSEIDTRLQALQEYMDRLATHM